jgi:hypothetical protein
MGISAYKEVTEWDNSEFVVPNHTYLFDGKSNILAYAKASNDELVILHKPLPLDGRRRKFIKVKHEALDAYGATIVLAPPPVANNINIFMVKSDSGKEYTVEKIDGKYSCNCIGFAYRGKCKHSDEIKEKVSKNV